jgi:hypothetical protein
MRLFLFGQPNKRIAQLKQIRKQKSMQNKTAKQNVDYTSLLPLMLSVHKAEMTLMDALLALWDKQTDKSKPMEFRKGFIEFAVANKYDRRWAMEIAVAAGFRARAAGGGRKASKPSDKPSDKPSGKGVTPEQLAHMARALDSKGVKKLIALLAAM